MVLAMAMKHGKVSYERATCARVLALFRAVSDGSIHICISEDICHDLRDRHCDVV